MVHLTQNERELLMFAFLKHLQPHPHHLKSRTQVLNSFARHDVVATTIVCIILIKKVLKTYLLLFTE